MLDSRCVLTVYSAKGGRLIEQLPLFDADSQPLESTGYPGESFQLTLEGGDVHLLHAPSKAERSSWLSSLSLGSQLDTVRHHWSAILIQRSTRRVLAVARLKRLRRYAVDQAALRRAVQEQLVSGTDAVAHDKARSGGRNSANGDSVTEALMQHEHFVPLLGWSGELLARIPAPIRVPAWCTEDLVKVASHQASQAEALDSASACDDLLPNGWKWVDAAWRIDYSGSKDPDAWQFARGLPVKFGWHPEFFFGSLVRRRKWIRVRTKIKVRPSGQNADGALNNIFVTTRKCTFIGKFKTSKGVTMNIWRPIVPALYRIVGDCITASDEP